MAATARQSTEQLNVSGPTDWLSAAVSRCCPQLGGVNVYYGPAENVGWAKRG